MIEENMRKELQQLCRLLNDKDYVKIYKKSIFELSADDESEKDQYSTTENAADFYINKNGVFFTYRLDDPVDIQQIAEWISGIRKIETTEKKIEFCGGKKYLSKKQVCSFIKKIKKKVKDIDFDLLYESYEEDIIFGNGIVEIRGFQSVIMEIDYKKVNFGSFVYTEMPQEQEFISEIREKIKNYKKLERFKKIDVNRDCDVDMEVECVALPRVAGQLFHESIGHLAEADVYESMRNEDVKIGDKVSNQQLSITDYPGWSGIETGIIFDEEMTLAKPLPIIKRGVFQGVMSDKEMHHKGEEYQLSGFCRSSIDNNMQQIRMRNLVVENGADEMEECISNIKYGFYIIESDDAKRENNRIYLHVKKALVIKDGTFIGKVENVWLQNLNREFLQSIAAVFDNGSWFELYKCRKNGGSIYISYFSPGIVCTMRTIRTFIKKFL